jgi:hypothetical protein
VSSAVDGLLSVFLDVPQQWRRHARFALESLAERISVPMIVRDERSAAQLWYGGEPGSRDVVWIPFDPALYQPRTACRLIHDLADRPLWGVVDGTEKAPPDLIGGAYRLLTYLDESQIQPSSRDRRGIFTNQALPAERQQTASEPLVENHAEALMRRLVGLNPALEKARIPRWPPGKTYAVLLTHDADAVDAAAPLEFANNLAKAIRRRSLQHLELVRLGLRHFGRKSQSPLFAFPVWRDWEEQRGIRSAFYLYYRPQGTKREWNDCRSGVAGPGTDWDLLRRLADDGWEFGLHPSIRVKDTLGAFGAARRWLESKLLRPVHGVRHHFWALDWHKPWETHRAQAEAGFRYDSSIAWRDQPGYRAGTALPYTPFDPERGETLPIQVVPCSLMDRHILYSGVGGKRISAAGAMEQGRLQLRKVKERGGLATLNWHQETGWNQNVYSGFLTALEGFLSPALSDSDAWFTTPNELCQHWQRLRGRLLPS